MSIGASISGRAAFPPTARDSLRAREEVAALRNHLGPEPAGRTISDATQVVPLTDILSKTCLGGRAGELLGRSVLVSTSAQLKTALAIIELDGIVRRMLLCPPNLNADHLEALIENAGIDAVVTDAPLRWNDAGVYLIIGVQLSGPSLKPPPGIRHSTEWLLLTSDDAGAPTIVRQTRDRLCGARLADAQANGEPPVWASFHDICCCEGLEIFLHAVIGGGSMVLSDHGEALADHVARLSARGVTHLSGAPSHWCELLARGLAAGLAPRHVRCSGGIADQALVDSLAQAFPNATVRNAGI